MNTLGVVDDVEIFALNGDETFNICYVKLHQTMQ